MATGVCRASTSCDLLLESPVALVDLVVVRDDLVAQLDVLRAERVDRARIARDTTSPDSWKPASRASRSDWNSVLIRTAR